MGDERIQAEGVDGAVGAQHVEAVLDLCCHRSRLDRLAPLRQAVIGWFCRRPCVWACSSLHAPFDE